MSWSVSIKSWFQDWKDSISTWEDAFTRLDCTVEC
jgi:hypothetical protein